MTFEGFDPAALRFFARLKRDNTKAFFDAHRDEYESSIRQPMEDLLGAAEEKYGSGRVTRPNRDVRFSPNKEPYRTNASMWAGAVGGVYMSLTLEGLEVGGGLYEPSRDQLKRARIAIDSRRLRGATALHDIVTKLTGDGFEIAGPSLKTAPRGYGREHPQIELLRLKHFAAIEKLPLSTSAARIFQSWTQVEPLIKWCGKYVGPAVS
ncbi:TIGR02453 family protein [Salinibacterium xinjiangense]|uniref:TIGR02453 family protein n=1 Tax=Salinibacterium xinjiangense TaxID=386302 RepID=A0A2C8Z4E3_9MICO|nr:DUF2461 domain-containing protein [Salinibacterium xinjiangense]GGK93646.1 TIGR02453 family protein [Salinibacterium xinjiangense]SOE58550.1 TIGR02453 family protein [Salinibacterium xinjiangense]